MATVSAKRMCVCVCVCVCVDINRERERERERETDRQTDCCVYVQSVLYILSKIT